MPISLFGAFSEPGYLAVADPYDKPKPKDAKTGAFKPGGKPKVLKYEGFVPLFVNEPYRDLLSGDVPSEEGPGKAKEEGKGPAPFRPSHPMKKSVGLGDYYGTLGGMMAHIDDPGPNRKLKKGDVKHMLPNIRTSPHQRGTYGFIGLTLGEKMGRKGKGYTGEYAYESDPYSLPLTRDEVEARRVKVVPFKPSSGHHPRGPGMPDRDLGTSYAFVPEHDYNKGEGTGKVERPHVVPFRPSHPSRSGWDGTIGRYPGYINDPIPAKLARTSQSAKQERNKLRQVPAWRPNGIAKDGPHPSIVQLNMRFTSNV